MLGILWSTISCPSVTGLRFYSLCYTMCACVTYKEGVTHAKIYGIILDSISERSITMVFALFQHRYRLFVEKIV